MTKYRHVEAFCLMHYATKDGREGELIWNSRDGVTPMFIHSLSGLEMAHVDWRHDRRQLNHTPAIGARVFVDLTPERAREKASAHVERSWDYPEHPMRAHPFFQPLGKLGAIEHFDKSWVEDHDGGNPDLIVVDDAFLARLAASRSGAA